MYIQRTYFILSGTEIQS